MKKTIRAALDAQPQAQLVEVSDSCSMLRNLMVPLRDGVALATDVYFPLDPALEDALPVVFERTPYGKHLPSRSELSADDPHVKSRAEVALHFVQQGYIVIFQDCRGCYASQGVFSKYINEAEDGFDTCTWIVAQPWSNGRIGTMGLSYAAHNQAALASLNAPGVVAMFLDSGGFSSAFQGGIRQGGAFEMKQATWALNRALELALARGDDDTAARLRQVDMQDWMSRSTEWSIGHSPLSAAPEYEAYFFEQWAQGNFDDYWRQAGLYAAGYYDNFPPAAMVHMSSWYDPYSRSASENYAGLRAVKQAPVHLILGPWIHGNRSFTYSGDADFGPSSTLDAYLGASFLDVRRQWFDRHLKQVQGATLSLPPVSIFVMGGGSGRRNAAGRIDHGGTWRTEQDWPIPGTQSGMFFLHGDGTLQRQPSAEEDFALQYRYDPHQPVPTIGGAVTSGEPYMFGGAFDQQESAQVFGATEPYRALAERDDVLVFESPILEHDVEVSGVVRARFWVASDCVDTDFTFKLIDLYPPSEDYPQGYALNLTDGILRARYRDSWENPSLMEPGKCYELSIEAFPISNLFLRGHRIRIDISSSNYPRFDCNPNTGEPDGASTRTEVATNRIFMDRQRPSHVVLPLAPARR
ncbi:CocE/NonD family hydrolase [Herbaspirillum sp. alder98]|uniref:CocE/NonD family hydrolase n=1 Tax=Herbaspirillum sp. alder98 TaxID=2913096 RepID=UPI001CD8AF9E|nr:CocE/NonD family hydrolase [Herbaspirillum sp. alder98]MCA1323219.1 CocE/NonD family hydrolase [Herbaspirillum sp. alder98]